MRIQSLYRILILLAVAATFSQCNEPAAPVGQFTFSVSSTDVASGGVIAGNPLGALCGGADLSPQMAWTGNVPLRVRSYAITVVDLSNGNFLQWSMYNIPTTTSSVPQGTSTAAGGVIGLNGNEAFGYVGPCPATGVTDIYEFKVWGLSVADLEAVPGIDISTSAKTLEAIARYSAISASFFGTFTGP